MSVIYPRVPHFPGSRVSRDDVTLAPDEERTFYEEDVIVLEKLDGVNVGVALAANGQVRAKPRYPFAPGHKERLARGLDIFVEQRDAELRSLLSPGDIAYGEWLFPRQSISYRAIPDVLVFFALRTRAGLLPLDRALERVERAGLVPNRPLFVGRLSGRAEVLSLARGPSKAGAPRKEGVIVEKRGRSEALRCAKWVDPRYRRRARGRLGAGTNRAG